MRPTMVHAGGLFDLSLVTFQKVKGWFKFLPLTLELTTIDLFHRYAKPPIRLSICFVERMVDFKGQRHLGVRALPVSLPRLGNSRWHRSALPVTVMERRNKDAEHVFFALSSHISDVNVN